MENKKTKLTISGNAKKSIDNIELAKTQSKNSVVIEKKTNRFSNKNFFKRPTGAKISTNQNPGIKSGNFSSQRPKKLFKTTSPITNDYEKRKLAEQRATRKIKGDSSSRDIKGKSGSKKEN